MASAQESKRTPRLGLGRVFGTALIVGSLMYLFNSPNCKGCRSQLGSQGRHLGATIRKSVSTRPVKRVVSLAPGLASGLLAKLRNRLQHEHVSDELLVERVRAKLGHVSPHLARIAITADNGVVTLRGSLPQMERPELVEAARDVPGVRAVIEDLD